MPKTECGRGHIYDTDLYPSCPYCNGGGKMISFDDAGNARKTAPIGMGETLGIGNLGKGSVTDQWGTSIGENVTLQPVQSGQESRKTVAPEEYRNREENANKTVSLSSRNMEFEPVVGWLVCIEGADKGKDYRLLDKRNTVGRSTDMDVCIKGDNTISRDRHAWVAYESRHNYFTLIPAENTNNIYLNDEPVYVPTKIEPYDCIEFGESKFVLIALCGERFTWQNGLQGR